MKKQIYLNLCLTLIVSILLPSCSIKDNTLHAQHASVTPTQPITAVSPATLTSGTNLPTESPVSTVPEGQKLQGIEAASEYLDVYKALYTMYYVQENLRPSYKYIIDYDLEESVSTGTVNADGQVTNDFSGTNIQVSGVDESDIVKTDGNYIYTFDSDSQTFSIIHADGLNMSLEAVVKLDEYELYAYMNGFYVVGNTVVFLLSNESHKNHLMIKILDISNKKTPTFIAERVQDGYYFDSRRIGSILYTFTNYYVDGNLARLDPNEISSYIPMVDNETISCDDILIPEFYSNSCYTLVTALNLDSPEVFMSTTAVLANPNNCYISNDNLYLCCQNWYTDGNDTDETQIIKLSLNDGIVTPTASSHIKGHLNNQFSLDEKDGFLRLVSTVDVYSYHEFNWQEESIYAIETFVDLIGNIIEKAVTANKRDIYLDDELLATINTDFLFPYTKRNYNALYILDSDLKQTGSIENLAENEQIYSARFLGNTGFFVTFRQTDPLFSVDLSDPYNPKILGSLKIPGFSSYLHPYSETLLLGIGCDADELTGTAGCLKLSMFDISDPSNVKEVHKLLINGYDNSSALYNHKSVLVNTENQLIGFFADGCEYAYNEQTDSVNSIYRYAYLCFGYDKHIGFYSRLRDENCFSEENYDDFYNNYYDNYSQYASERRGLYINNTFYVVNTAWKITAYNMDDLSIKHVFELPDMYLN